jgi:glutamate racemase
MGNFGRQPGEVDQLVLGCTHYPLVSDVLQGLLGSSVTLLDAGSPVSLQTRRVLDQAQLLSTDRAAGVTQLLSTGAGEPLGRNALRWLGLELAVGGVHTDAAH